VGNPRERNLSCHIQYNVLGKIPTCLPILTCLASYSRYPRSTLETDRKSVLLPVGKGNQVIPDVSNDTANNHSNIPYEDNQDKSNHTVQGSS
jgi:hypothetical protein